MGSGLKIPFLLLSILASLAVYAAGARLGDGAGEVLAITAFAGVMWFTEAAPLHVTALLSSVLLIVSGRVSPAGAFSPYFSPTIVLFFGGFVIARAMQKHGLDRKMASSLLSRFGTDPGRFLLGLMAVTAFLSLWISNTAAAAMMLPIGLVAIARSGAERAPYPKAVVLGIAFAATIGGIGTVVGTPPNGIVVADLSSAGIDVTFLEWLSFGMPVVVLLLPIAWLVLMRVFPPGIKEVRMEREGSPLSREHKLIIAVLFLTIAAWVSSFIHGVHDSAVAVSAVVLLYALGLLDTGDVSRIDWATLLLFGGGLSLGTAIDSSGAGAFLGQMLGTLVAGQGTLILFLLVSLFTVLLTLSASNTATAALLVPIVIPLASAAGAGVKELAVLAGIATSLDFLVPVGTPPSAIAYSSGYITVRDMLRAGIWITLAGVLLLSLFAYFVW